MKKMKKVLFSIAVFAVASLTSCKVEADPDLAAEMVGVYSVTSYRTHTGSSSGDLSNEKISYSCFLRASFAKYQHQC